ncbi:MAG: hypothetical protein RL328_773 [Acidobacteriota bacterium]|jgi:hypothetical protein
METSGFQLSQFDRAPQVPTNIGVVDTKGIYASVVDALKTFEAMRTTQQVQATTDAELALARQKAETERRLLQPEAEARAAKAQLLTASTPYEIGLLQPEAEVRRGKAQLFAAGLPGELGMIPSRQDTERAKLAAEKVTADIMSDPALARQLVLMKSMSPAERSRQSAIKALEDPNSGDIVRRAAAVQLGLEAKAVAPGISYQVFTDSNGRTQLVATDTRNIGAFNLATGVGTGSLTGGPSMAPRTTLLPQPTGTPAAVAPTAAPAAPVAPAAAAPAAAMSLVQTPTPARPVTDATWLGQSAVEKATGQDISQIKSEWFKKLPAMEASLREMETKVKEGETALDKAEQQISAFSTGFLGKMLRDVGGTPALDLQETLKPVRTNIFTQELATMRANSPTGGAVGNVTDTEGAKFEAALGSLDTAQSAGQLQENIATVREARRNLVNNLRQTIAEYRKYLAGYAGTPGGGGAMTREQELEAAAARYR